MAHGRQEGALGLVRLLGALPRFLGFLEKPGVLEGDGGLLREPNKEGKVCTRERLERGGPPYGQDASHLAAHDERGAHQSVLVIGFGARDGDDPRIAQGVVDHLGLGRADDVAEDSRAPHQWEVLDRVGQLANGHLRVEHVRVVAAQVDDARVGDEKRSRPLGDHLQDSPELERGGDLSADIGEGGHLIRSLARLRVELGVLNGDVLLIGGRLELRQIALEGLYLVLIGLLRVGDSGLVRLVGRISLILHALERLLASGQ